MPEHLKNPPKKKSKRVEKPFFIVYRVECHAHGEPEDRIELEISPYSLLVAASVISENSEIDTETSYSLAMLNIIANLEECYTVIGVNQR